MREEVMDDPQDTPTVVPQEKPEDDVVTIPEDAFVIIDSVKVIPLTKPVINIGRRLENNIVIDDPRVSRNHAQMRAINGRYVLFDLNSTGGTYINGQKITQSIIYPGDVVSLAGVNMIYGQKNPPPRPDLKPTSPFDQEKEKQEKKDS
jgi:pSer/pThr/pTyr-binding forkhead associated (FHA) protein